jgi:putative transposase
LKRNELKYKFIKTEKKACPTALLCKVMKLSRSGYYSWESRDKSKSQKELSEFAELPV